MIRRSHNIKRLGSIAGIILLLCIPLGFYGYAHRLEIIQSPLVARLIPLYRSVRKVPDILFMPVTIFHKNELPVYTLSIAPENISILNDSLPENPFGLNTMGESDKVWVDARFSYGEYEENVKVRYRGNQASHWNAFKKSYLIKFPKENLFQGMKELTLIIPSKRRYLATSLNNYRARKMGLIVPQEEMVRMHINGADSGVYIAFEHWSQEWIEKNPISATSQLFGVGDVDGSIVGNVPHVYDADGINSWKSWNTELPFTSLEQLISFTQYATDEEFERFAPMLLDMEEFYARYVIEVLAGAFHITGDEVGVNNIIFLFDGTRGRFRPVPYNASLFPLEDKFPGSPSLLQRRMWSIPKFRKERDEYFAQYIDENKEDDIAFIQDWIDTYRMSFLADNAKSINNFQFLSDLSNIKKSSIAFLDDPFDKKSEQFETNDAAKTGVTFAPEFSYIISGTESMDVFLQKNPQFYKNENQLVLPAGFYFFSKNVIIPANTNLIIKPGTHILMGEGASFISYSPVYAEGTVYAPIRIQGQTEKPWGVFVVFNTEDVMSRFSHIELSGGGEDVIQGSYVSGMLAIHNGNASVQNVTFGKNYGDDQLNVKGGVAYIQDSYFENSFSDGIDLDYVDVQSFVRKNTFVNIGGDAIDISWSDLDIKNNTISQCIDKGISLGESSRAQIYGMNIERCDIGVAIKDSSYAYLEKNKFTSNRVAITAYQKKLFFGGGNGEIGVNTFTNNHIQYEQDSLSNLMILGDNKSHEDN